MEPPASWVDSPSVLSGERGKTMEELYELSRPFPAALVKQKPGKFAADYVDHATVNQRLLEVCGPFSWHLDAPIHNPDGVLVGCQASLHLVIDGVAVTITEVGDVERPSGNGASDLKSAMSDAFKRCAMRVGVGLHLWAGEAYFLDRALKKRLDSGYTMSEAETVAHRDADRVTEEAF
jgi:hypothetical protein